MAVKSVSAQPDYPAPPIIVHLSPINTHTHTFQISGVIRIGSNESMGVEDKIKSTRVSTDKHNTN